MQTWFYELSLVLGIYMPLIAINCLVLSSAEEFSLRNTVVQSFLNSLRLGSGLVVLLLIIGVLREISGFGTVLQQADLLFGESASSWKIGFLDGELKFAVFKLAPGAFIILGLVLASKNFLETRIGHNMS
jgi:electron transport complex protein RnfE